MDEKVRGKKERKDAPAGLEDSEDACASYLILSYLIRLNHILSPIILHTPALSYLISRSHHFPVDPSANSS